jgi:hypothetical protein
MSFVITGPYPSNLSQVILPSPQLSNTEGLASTVQVIRMMDNSVNTFVAAKRSRKKMRFSFRAGHLKAKELEDYVLQYGGEPCSISWRDTKVGWLTLNPVDMRGEAVEMYEITLEFEEKK